jgi:hypothetical protein
MRTGVQEDTRAINHNNGKQPIIEHVVGCGEADVHDTCRKSLQESMFSIYVLIHVVQTNLKYLCTVSCNILYRRKPSICVMYLYLLINKTQTQLKIYWRSDHFDVQRKQIKCPGL